MGLALVTEKSAFAAREIFSLFRSRDGTISGKRDCYKAERIKVFIEKGGESRMKIDRMIGILSILLQQEQGCCPMMLMNREIFSFHGSRRLYRNPISRSGMWSNKC